MLNVVCMEEGNHLGELAFCCGHGNAQEKYEEYPKRRRRFNMQHSLPFSFQITFIKTSFHAILGLPLGLTLAHFTLYSSLSHWNIQKISLVSKINNGNYNYCCAKGLTRWFIIVKLNVYQESYKGENVHKMWGSLGEDSKQKVCLDISVRCGRNNMVVAWRQTMSSTHFNDVTARHRWRHTRWRGVEKWLVQCSSWSVWHLFTSK